MNITTRQTPDSNGVYEISVDGQDAGVVVKLHRGWEARRLGVNIVHATKAEAIQDLHDRHEGLTSTETDVVSIDNLFVSWEEDRDSTRKDITVHLPGGVDAKIVEMVKEGPQVFLSVRWFDWTTETYQGAILTPSHVRISWVCY